MANEFVKDLYFVEGYVEGVYVQDLYMEDGYVEDVKATLASTFSQTL